MHDDGWASPGCVMAYSGDLLRVFWPDENVFTRERADDLALYDSIFRAEEVAA